MNRKTMILAASLSFAAVSTRAALQPETFDGLVWTRGETNSMQAGTRLTGIPVQFTNCVANLAPVGTNAAAPQDLTGLGGYLSIGNPNASTQYQITVQVATAGVFSCAGAIPSVTALILTNRVFSNLAYWQSDQYSIRDTTVRFQLTLTNGAAQTYTYPGDKQVATRAALP